MGVLSRRDSLEGEHGIEVGLVLVPAWQTLEDTGHVCCSNCLVLADHQQLGIVIVIVIAKCCKMLAFWAGWARKYPPLVNFYATY